MASGTDPAATPALSTGTASVPVEADVVEIPAGELQRQVQKGPLPRPVKSPKLLPLAELDSEVFERLVTELVALAGSPSVHFYGRRGQRQYGLDIVEVTESGDRVLYQVKRYASITGAQIRAAVEEYAGPPHRVDPLLPGRRFDPRRFVVVTSALVDDDTARVDVIAELTHAYAQVDLEIAVWGAETMSRKLRQYPILVESIFGPAWAEEYCGHRELKQARKDAARKRRIDEALEAAMSTQYTRDNEIRFRQIELIGPSVDSLFVDVPASSQPGSAAEELLSRINPDGLVGPGEADRLVGAGAAQALLHPEWAGSAVVVGGPGQGKTTLLQYVCQFHRARALGIDEYSPVAAGLQPVTHTVRTSIRLDLPLFAEWRRDYRADPAAAPAGSRGRADAPALLEVYIADLVYQASGTAFDVQDLYAAVADRPFLIALDGLDEVADAEERQQISDEIRDAQGRLDLRAVNLVVLIATRPGAVERPLWRHPRFVALYLEQLTSPLRMQYLDRWTAQSQLTAREIEDLRGTFTDSIGKPHVRELAGNPMQLAILLHLMQRRTVLPEKRTVLYDRYIDIFFDREAKDPAIAEHKPVLIDFHKLIAWHIHTAMERGTSSGAVTLAEIEQLLTGYLAPRGLDPTTISALFKAVTLRVVCLVQRDLATHEFQFDVQPLREYFAASYLYDTAAGSGPKNARSACLAELAKRPFWNNVARFYAGRFTAGEVPGIPYALRAMQSTATTGAHPVSRTVAKQLLDDQVLVGQLELMTTDVVKVIFDGSGPILAVDGLIDQGETRPHFQPAAGAKQAAQVLIGRLQSATEPVLVAAAVQLLEDLDAGDKAAQVWWERVGEIEPAAWMATAARLSLLDDAEPARVTAVDSLLGRLDASVDALPFLTASPAAVLSDLRVRRGIEELRRGHGGLIDPVAEPGNPYVRLVAASTAASLRESASRDNPVARASAENAAADPARWTVHVTSLETAYAARAAGQLSWPELLDTVATLWGEDCWPVREAVLTMPTEHVLGGNSSDSAAIDVGTPWRGVAGWLTEAREHRADVTWWTTSSRSCIDELASMTFVAAAMLYATNETVVGLAAELTDHTGRLSRPRWATTAAAVQRSAGYQGARQLMLEQPLRLGRLIPGGRLAVLIWHLSAQQTRGQLYRHLAAGLPGLWQSGPSTTVALRDFTAHYRGAKLDVDLFQGARAALPPGTLGAFPLKQMTFTAAQQILTEPGAWPTDIVRSAADRLAHRLAQQPPVDEIAVAHGWFA